MEIIPFGSQDLDNILGRMQEHQSKKRSMLRELRLAHSLPAELDTKVIGVSTDT